MNDYVLRNEYIRLLQRVQRMQRLIHRMSRELGNCITADDLACITPARRRAALAPRSRCLLPRTMTNDSITNDRKRRLVTPSNSETSRKRAMLSTDYNRRFMPPDQ